MVILMNKTGAYKILPDNRLIVEYYSGQIFMDDFIQLKKVISFEPGYDPTYYSVLDFRDAEVNVNKSDMYRYFEFVKNYPKVYGERYTAYLTSTPNDVVVTTIFSSLLENKDLPIHTRIFSTLHAIVKWFNNKDIDLRVLNETLNELKTHPVNVLKEDSSLYKADRDKFL